MPLSDMRPLLASADRAGCDLRVCLKADPTEDSGRTQTGDLKADPTEDSGRTQTGGLKADPTEIPAGRRPVT